MSAYILFAAKNTLAVVLWPLTDRSRANRMFWCVLLGIATVLNIFGLNTGYGVFFLILSAFLFGYEWAAFYYRVDDNLFEQFEQHINQIIYDRDEALADVAEYRFQLRDLENEIHYLKDRLSE